MAVQVYMAIAEETVGGINTPKVGAAKIKIENNNDGTYTARGDQGHIDIVSAIFGWAVI